MKFLFLILLLKLFEIKCFVINIEFKLVKNSTSDLDLDEILENFTKLNKTNEILQNKSVDSFLFWNKYIDLEKLNFSNQTNEDKILNQLVELSPFKDLVESAKKKSSTTTKSSTITAKTDFKTTTKNGLAKNSTLIWGSKITKFTYTYSNTTTARPFLVLNTTSINNFNNSTSYKTNFSISTNQSTFKTVSTEPTTIANNKTTSTTIKNVSQSTATTTTTTTSTKSTSNINNTFKSNTSTIFVNITTVSNRISTLTTDSRTKSSILTTLSKTTLSNSQNTFQKKTTISSSSTLFNEYLNCTPSFCHNFGHCYLDYLQEPACKCLDYRLVYYDLIIEYYSGKYCEKISYSVTYMGLSSGLISASLIFFTILFTCSTLWKCCCGRKEKEGSHEYRPSNTEIQNESFEPDLEEKKEPIFRAECERKPKVEKEKKNSWKYIKMNFDLRKKNRKKQLYIKKKIKLQGGSSTIQKYLDKHARNLFKSMEGLMNTEQNVSEDENFIIVKRKMNASLPNVSPSAPILNKDSFSLSLSDLNALCSSNVCVYPKPSRNTNGQSSFNRTDNEITFVNGALFY